MGCIGGYRGKEECERLNSQGSHLWKGKARFILEMLRELLKNFEQKSDPMKVAC